MAAVAVRVVRSDGLPVELGEQNVRDGAMNGLRRVLQDVGEADVQTAFAQADRGVQRRKAAEPNVQRRDRSARAEFAVLLFKERSERGGLREGWHSFSRLAWRVVGGRATYPEVALAEPNAGAQHSDKEDYDDNCSQNPRDTSLNRFNEVLRGFTRS